MTIPDPVSVVDVNGNTVVVGGRTRDEQLEIVDAIRAVVAARAARHAYVADVVAVAGSIRTANTTWLAAATPLTVATQITFLYQQLRATSTQNTQLAGAVALLMRAVVVLLDEEAESEPPGRSRRASGVAFAGNAVATFEVVPPTHHEASGDVRAEDAIGVDESDL